MNDVCSSVPKKTFPRLDEVLKTLRLFLYFGPQYVVKITEQRAVEHVDQEGKFQQEPVNKLGGRAVLFLSDSGRLLRPSPLEGECYQ